MVRSELNVNPDRYGVLSFRLDTKVRVFVKFLQGDFGNIY